MLANRFVDIVRSAMRSVALKTCLTSVEKVLIQSADRLAPADGGRAGGTDE